MLVNGLRSLKELLALPLRSVLKLHGTLAHPVVQEDSELPPLGGNASAKVVLLNSNDEQLSLCRVQ